MCLILANNVCSDSNNAKVKQLLMVYDDELRNSVSGHGPYQSIDEFDYDAKLRAAEVPTKIHVCHLVPKVGHSAPSAC